MAYSWTSRSPRTGAAPVYREPFSKNGILDFSQFDRYAENLIENYDIRSGRGGKTILRSMSGGNQQKAIVAREIEEHSKLIIFVQPTRGLDIGAIENIHRQIVAEQDKGTAVLLISWSWMRSWNWRIPSA